MRRASEVQVRGEDLGRGPEPAEGQSAVFSAAADLGQHPHRQRMARVGLASRAPLRRGRSLLARPRRLAGAQIADPQAGRQRGPFPGSPSPLRPRGASRRGGAPLSVPSVRHRTRSPCAPPRPAASSPCPPSTASTRGRGRPASPRARRAAPAADASRPAPAVRRRPRSAPPRRPSSPPEAAPGPAAAASAGPACRAAFASALPTASRTPPSPAHRSAPRSHTGGRGRTRRPRGGRRGRRVPVVRPLPGLPTRATAEAPLPTNRRQVLGHFGTVHTPGRAHTLSTAGPTRSPPSAAALRPGSGRAPNPATVAPLRASTAPNGPSGSLDVRLLAAAPRSPAARPGVCSAVPRTPSTAPVAASSTGEPDARLLRRSSTADGFGQLQAPGRLPGRGSGRSRCMSRTPYGTAGRRSRSRRRAASAARCAAAPGALGGCPLRADDERRRPPALPSGSARGPIREVA